MFQSMATNFQKRVSSLLEIISRYNLIEQSFVHYCVINPLLTRNNNQTIIIIILINRSDRFVSERKRILTFSTNKTRQKSIKKWRIRLIKGESSSKISKNSFVWLYLSDHEILFINSIRSSSRKSFYLTIFELTTCINCYL